MFCINPYQKTVLRTHEGVFGLIAVFVKVPTRRYKAMVRQAMEDLKFFQGIKWEVKGREELGDEGN